MWGVGRHPSLQFGDLGKLNQGNEPLWKGAPQSLKCGEGFWGASQALSGEAERRSQHLIAGRSLDRRRFSRPVSLTRPLHDSFVLLKPWSPCPRLMDTTFPQRPDPFLEPWQSSGSLKTTHAPGFPRSMHRGWASRCKHTCPRWRPTLPHPTWPEMASCALHWK